jgi:hypothetical protein
VLIVGELKLFFDLTGTEGDDAANGIVRRDANGDTISRHDFDSESAHAAAQLGENLVTRVALHTIQAAAVNSHDRALHIDEVVLTQSASIPFAV